MELDENIKKFLEIKMSAVKPNGGNINGSDLVKCYEYLKPYNIQYTCHIDNIRGFVIEDGPLCIIDGNVLNILNDINIIRFSNNWFENDIIEEFSSDLQNICHKDLNIAIQSLLSIYRNYKFMIQAYNT